MPECVSGVKEDRAHLRIGAGNGEVAARIEGECEIDCEGCRDEGPVKIALAPAEGVALFRLRDLARDGLYVVDQDQKPVGVVTELDVVRAVQEGISDLDSVMQRDFPQNVASETLAGIYDCCASGVPVAVVNDQGQLVLAVRRKQSGSLHWRQTNPGSIQVGQWYHVSAVLQQGGYTSQTRVQSPK